jgi:hypothetical protein
MFDSHVSVDAEYLCLAAEIRDAVKYTASYCIGDPRP